MHRCAQFAFIFCLRALEAEMPGSRLIALIALHLSEIRRFSTEKWRKRNLEVKMKHFYRAISAGRESLHPLISSQSL